MIASARALGLWLAVAPRTWLPPCLRLCSWPSSSRSCSGTLLSLPIGWTHELSVILWVWLVLWGAAFVLTEREEIRFDIIYGAVGPGHAGSCA